MRTFTTAILTLLFVTITLTLSGCGSGGAVVSGTVKFSDGTPLNFGSVIFDNGTFSFTGIIKEDGAYVAGLDKTMKIPAGGYRVYLQGTTESQTKEDSPKTVIGIDGNPVPVYDTVIIERVAAKYTSPDTSGLTIEVQSGGKQTFDITVEKP